MVNFAIKLITVILLHYFGRYYHFKFNFILFFKCQFFAKFQITVKLEQVILITKTPNIAKYTFTMVLHN